MRLVGARSWRRSGSRRVWRWREEIDEIAPAVEQARAEGINAVGPLPADSLLWAAEKGAFDGVVALYHDQGVIPLKRHGYVTVIAGTPIIRTTAGHGTAYDIAWQGKADATVMARAVTTAADLAVRRKASPAASN